MSLRRLRARAAGSARGWARSPVRVVVLGLSLSCLLLLGACSAGQDDVAVLPVFTSAAGNFNDADVHFAQQMAPHHDQAIEMSRMVLEKKPQVRPEVRAVAEAIVADDGPEIDVINGWLKAWGKESEVGGSGTTGGHHGGGGVLSETEMRELDKSGGLAGEKLFLTEMVRHHKGAVALAEAEIQDGTNPAAVAFATHTKVVQTEQIAVMQRLLEAG